jgi:predicted RNA methylase
VPTPNEIAEAMLQLANVKWTDVVYDLGCGDSRTVIAAADRFGARGIDIDIDPNRVIAATANAKKAGVANRLKLAWCDLFEADFNDATEVVLFVERNYNRKLRPRLREQ